MDIDWDLLIQQEEAGKQQKSERFLDAYDQDESMIALADEDQEDPYSDDIEGEFGIFAEQDPDFVVGYGQLDQIAYGGGGLGTTIGGKFSRIEKMIQAQSASPQEMYLNKLKYDLSDYFSFEKASHYAARIQEVPRFWLKNGPTIAATVYMIDSIQGRKPTSKDLENASAETGVRKEDLLRYYRLLEKYSLF